MDLKLAAGVGLASPLVQLGLFIKEIHLAGAAVLEKADDSLGCWARSLGSENAGGGQGGEGEGAEAAGGLAEEGAAGELERIHWR